MKNEGMIKILMRIKTVLIILSVIGIIIFGSALDTEGPAFKVITIGFIISIICLVISMLIEKFIVERINDTYFDLDDDEEFEEELLDGYYTWLNENNYSDTKNNYDYYCAYIA